MQFIKYNTKSTNKVIEQPSVADPTKVSPSPPQDPTVTNTEADQNLVAHGIYCPNCHANDIHILQEHDPNEIHHFRYLCLVCRSKFNDDSKTPFELMMPPIEVWLQCWFLLGTIDSIEYIAAKLHLDPALIKIMVQELQALFGRPQVNNNTSYEKWSQKYAALYSAKIKNEVFAKNRIQELYQGENTGQPIDTAEVRRQKSRKQQPQHNRLLIKT